MRTPSKRDQILDAFHELLINDNIHHISVSDIAKQAGISKGSIYYYFSSKDEILDALIERIYADAVALAKELISQTDLSIFTRLSQIINACIAATQDFIRRSELSKETTVTTDLLYGSAYIHQQFMKYNIGGFKEIFTEIIQQEIDKGTIQVDSAAEIAEIVLIVLTVKLDNILSPATEEEISKTLQAMITLLERGTGNHEGAFGITFLK